MDKFLMYVVGSIFQGIASIFLIGKIGKVDKNKSMIFGAFSSLISLLNGFLIPNQLRFLSSLVLFSVVIYFALKIKDKRAIIYPLIIMMFLAISEIITTIIMVMFGIDSADIVNNVLLNIFANIFISIVAITLICIPFINKFANKITNFFITNRRMIYYLYLFILILYLLVSKNGLELLLKTNLYINILFAIGVTILIILIIVNEQKQLRLKEVNKMALNYIQKYEKIITDQGKANHEFKNQLMVIKGYADMNSPKLKDYLNTIVKDASKGTSTYLISQLNKFPDGGVKGLLYYKLSIMEEKGIKYEIYSNDDVKPIAKKMSAEQMTSLTKILGVLIDNAIEAASNAKEKSVTIELTKDSNNSLLFNISNTYKGKISQEKIGTGYTTKGKGHGYGLRLVDDILKSNQNISYTSEIKDKFYNVNLIISQNKKKK